MYREAVQFYETYPSLATKMASKLKRHFNKLLEPSAGRGALINAVNESYEKVRYASIGNIYACELSPEFRTLLGSKNIPVLCGNFLESNLKSYAFDSILMNPPFKDGDKHFLKAWETLCDGGRLVCLLNAETLRNPYSKTRQLVVSIVEENESTIEFIDDAFSAEAQRKASVDCVLIVVDKPQKEDDFGFLRDELDNEINSLILGGTQDSGFETSALVKHDKIASLVACYNKTRDAYADVFESYRKIDFFSPINLGETITAPSDYSTFLDHLRRQCWIKVFEETKLVNYMSGAMKDEFLKFQEQEATKEFTIANINQLLHNLVLNQQKIMEKSIEQVFDLFTRYHEENRCHVEGWKTNDHWKVNRKVIIPRIVENFYGDISMTYTGSDHLADIEKAICLMTGVRFEDVSARWNPNNKSPHHHRSSMEEVLKKGHSYRKVTTGKWHDSEFFRVKVFKKGTAHLEFKDLKLWEEFNKVACGYKNWLGN